jgi:phage-related protein
VRVQRERFTTQRIYELEQRALAAAEQMRATTDRVVVDPIVVSRVLYRRSGNLFVLLHMIRKTSKVVPRAEIEIAKVRWQDLKDRIEARPRKRPARLAGMLRGLSSFAKLTT